jgi:hypothetical protein
MLLSKLTYLALCRSIQLLSLHARGDAAKDLEILVPRHQLMCSAARSHDPGLSPPIGPCSPQSAVPCLEPAGHAAS